MKKHTRTYRRDLKPKGIHWAQEDTESWQDALGQLERFRTKLPKQFEQQPNRHYLYEHARNVLEDVGSVEGTPTAHDARYLEPEQRRRAAQDVLTRLSHILDPKDHGKDQQGNGEGDGDGEGEGEKESYASEGPKSEDGEYRAGGTNGGGAQFHSNSKDQSIFYATRFLIKKLAEHDDRTNRQPLGHDTWNAQKLLAAHYKPNQLPIAKEGWGKQVDDVYLTLDTSGSVNMWAEMIAGVAAGSAGIVHLYTGGEADPYYYVNRKTPLEHPGAPFPEWTTQGSLFDWTGDRADWERFDRAFMQEYQPFYPHLYSGCFEPCLAWLIKTQKPKKGSRLLFWGDTEGTGILAPKLVKQLVTDYRMAWLYSEDFWYLKELQDRSGLSLEEHLERCVKDPTLYPNPEYIKLMGVGIPVIPEVTTPDSFRRALKVLQTQK